MYNMSECTIIFYRNLRFIYGRYPVFGFVTGDDEAGAEGVTMKGLGFFITLLLVCLPLFCSCRSGEKGELEQKELIKIAVPKDVISGPVLIAREFGYIEAEGLEVDWDITYSSGKLAFEDMFRDETDLCLVATTPVALYSFSRDDFAIFLTYTTSYDAVKLVTRRDTGIMTVQDLRGRRVGITAGTISQILLDSALIYNEIEIDELDIINIVPTDAARMLKAGEVDAISSWSNFVYESQELLGDNFTTIPTSKVYRIAINMATMKSFINEKPHVIRMVIRGMKRAVDYMNDNPDDAQLLISEILEEDIELIRKDWQNLTYKLALDQLLILTMENEAKWAIRHKYTEATEIPDFLNYIYYKALEEEIPEAVTIIRELK